MNYVTLIIESAVKKVLRLAFICGLVFSATSHASVDRSERIFSGTVTQINSGLVMIKNGAQQIKYDGQSADIAAKGIRVGDVVTVFSEDGRPVIQRGAPVKVNGNQEAGQIGHDILDDRAFYSASSVL